MFSYLSSMFGAHLINAMAMFLRRGSVYLTGAGAGVFDSILKYAGLAVQGWGAAIAIVGIIDFANGNSQQNAAKKDEGFGKLVGGAVIFAVGTVVVPLLKNYLS